MRLQLKKAIIKTIFFVIAFLYHTTIVSQTISGVVYSKLTKEPLFGATVYLDGTSIGSYTDTLGHFTLNTKNSQNAPLVISFMGHRTQIIQPENIKDNLEIYLEEMANQLDEVVVLADTWSRKKKLNYFKEEFLGKTPISKQCKILNEDDIKLYYNSKSNMLIASSDAPIIIKNKYLGYKIAYNIVDFEIQFQKIPNGLNIINSVYYAGTSFFNELYKAPRKKHIKNREKAFKGSLIHFMRALSKKQLHENNFRIFYKRFPAPPYKYFEFDYLNDQVKITPTVNRLSILYNNTSQSYIQMDEDHSYFHIDQQGNFSPPTSILLGGDFGLKRMSEMLPLDYISKD